MKKPAAKIPVLCLLVFPWFFAHPLAAQDENNAEAAPVTLSLGTVRTEAEAAAVRFLVQVADDLPGIFEANFTPEKKSGSLFDLSPSVTIETGTNDSFNGVLAKISGNYIVFRETTIAGLVTPDSSKPFHAFPVSAGFESDRNFRNINLLAEAGWVPFRRLGPRELLGVNPRIGLFVQAGYKVKNTGASTNDRPVGGAKDESKEAPNSGLLRFKLDSGLNLAIGSLGKFRTIRIIANAAGWYDIANAEFYHELEGVLRLALTKDRFFDLKYEDGSGAPNFNKGEQFSANLTIVF